MGGGAKKSSIEALKLDHHGNVVECSHSLLSPSESKLIHATGGVMTVPNTTNESIVAVVCGGEFTSENSNSHYANDMCMFLLSDNSDHNQIKLDAQQFHLTAGGHLNYGSRIGAAILVVDNGGTLWVTGGENNVNDLNEISDTEFVAILTPTEASASKDFSTNVVGLELHRAYSHHCLEKIAPEVAVLIDGEDDRKYTTRIQRGYKDDSLIFSGCSQHSTWSIDLRTMAWKEEADRHETSERQTCGVVRFGKDGDGTRRWLVVVAGGRGELQSILNVVETLTVTKEVEEYNFAPDWEYGPSLPEKLMDAASATASDQTAFFIVGGATASVDSQYVFQFSCSLTVAYALCSWSKVGYELKTTSTIGLAFALPSSPMVPRGYPDTQDCGKGRLIICTKCNTISFSFLFVGSNE